MVVSESTSTTTGPVVGVYLGSVAAASDATLGNRITSALAAGTVVVPVVESLAQFTANVHPSLAFANGFEWSTPEAARKLARILLENLGIEDRERRVFISYKRDDGLGAAEQLHDHLTHAGEPVFLSAVAGEAAGRIAWPRAAARGRREVQISTCQSRHGPGQDMKDVDNGAVNTAAPYSR